MQPFQSFLARLCLTSLRHTGCAYRVFPNCTARAKGVRQTLVGQQLLDKHDVSAIRARRPCDRGYVVNWDLQREVWNHAFTSLLDISPASSGLLLTEPLFNLPAMQDATQQVSWLHEGCACTAYTACRHSVFWNVVCHFCDYACRWCSKSLVFSRSACAQLPCYLCST